MGKFNGNIFGNIWETFGKMFPWNIVETFGNMNPIKLLFLYVNANVSIYVSTYDAINVSPPPVWGVETWKHFNIEDLDGSWWIFFLPGSNGGSCQVKTEHPGKARLLEPDAPT